MCKVSIIMGIYNCEKTVDTAIESILNQTYSNWELIMCDDGSSDATYKKAQSYADKYPDKIKLLKNSENMGLNKTLNKCLKVAKGDYIARQDADDESMPLRIEKQMDFFKTNPEIAILGTNMVIFDKNGEWGKSNYKQNPSSRDFIRCSPFAHPTTIFKKEAIVAVNGYDEGTHFIRVEDYHLWLKMYQLGYKGYNLPDILYRYRDDREDYGKRNFINRKNEMYVKFLIYKEFKLPVINCLFILKPMVTYLLPNSLYHILHTKKNGK